MTMMTDGVSAYGATPMAEENGGVGERFLEASTTTRKTTTTRLTKLLSGGLTLALVLSVGAVTMRRATTTTMGNGAVNARVGGYDDDAGVAREGSAIGSSWTAALGQAATRTESVRDALAKAFDHLECTKTCIVKHDGLAAKVARDDTSLLCADFQKYAHEDDCVQQCGCEDKKTIAMSVDYLCGSDAPDDPNALHSDAFYEKMTTEVIMACRSPSS